jgi:hypothetical protein
MTRIPAPLEENEQRWLFQWAADAVRRWPELALMHAIPNGGKRDRVTAAKLKGEGVKPGIPDIFLPVPRGGFHGLYIELKRTKGGRPSEAQKDMIPRLREQGYRVEICKGFNAAADVIERYLGSRE